MKKLKLIIPVIIVIIALAIAGVVIFAGDKIAITGKNKIERGLSKDLDVFEETEELFLQKYGNYKYLANIENQPFESSFDISVNADIKNLEDLVGDEDLADIITSAIKEISDAKLNTTVAVDKANKQAVVGANLVAKNILGEISGEVAFTDKEVAMRSKDLNKKYLIATEDDEGFEDYFDFVKNYFEKDFSKAKLTDEEIKYFKDTYGKIFEETVTADELNSSKGEFTVDGATKSCDITKVTLNNEKVKELLKKYVETYKNDEKGKTILREKFNTIYGEEISDQLFEQLEDFCDEFDEIIDEMEDTEFEYTTYGTVLNLYGNEWKITVDGEVIDIVKTFNKDNTNIVVSDDGEEVLNVTVKETKDEFSIDGKLTISGLTCNLNVSMTNELTTIKIESENIVTVEISVNRDTKVDTETEFNQDVALEVSLNVPTYNIEGSVNINLSEDIKIVDSISYPDTSKAVSISDSKKISEYMEDCEEAINEYSEKIQDSDIYNAISEYTSSKYNSYSYDDYDWDLDDYSTSYDDEIDSDDLKSEIKDWYDGLEKKSGETKAQSVEKDMIDEYDFSELVDVYVYTSWEESKKEEKGYLGIEVVDFDDNSYEFYIDLSKDKVYDENDVPFDVSEISWYEY